MPQDEPILGFLSFLPAEGILDQLFVKPSAKEHGIGSRLLLQAMTKMPSGFWLRAAKENVFACSFYERRGMRLIRDEPCSGQEMRFCLKLQAFTPFPPESFKCACR